MYHSLCRFLTNYFTVKALKCCAVSQVKLRVLFWNRLPDETSSGKMLNVDGILVWLGKTRKIWHVHIPSSTYCSALACPSHFHHHTVYWNITWCKRTNREEMDALKNTLPRMNIHAWMTLYLDIQHRFTFSYKQCKYPEPKDLSLRAFRTQIKADSTCPFSSRWPKLHYGSRFQSISRPTTWNRIS